MTTPLMWLSSLTSERRAGAGVPRISRGPCVVDTGKLSRSCGTPRACVLVASELQTLDFREEVDGVPYIVNPDSSVTAKMPIGVRRYGSWAAFRRATRTQRWE